MLERLSLGRKSSSWSKQGGGRAGRVARLDEFQVPWKRTEAPPLLVILARLLLPLTRNGKQKAGSSQTDRQLPQRQRHMSVPAELFTTATDQEQGQDRMPGEARPHFSQQQPVPQI